jgi:hypothetical protein
LIPAWADGDIGSGGRDHGVDLAVERGPYSCGEATSVSEHDPASQD